MAASVVAWPTISPIMREGSAPSATRTPTSRVRSLTTSDITP